MSRRELQLSGWMHHINTIQNVTHHRRQQPPEMILFRAFRRRAPIVYDTRGARQVVRVRYRPHEQPEWAHGTHRRFSSGLGRYSGRRVDATVTTDGGLVIKRTNWSYAGPVLLATSTVTT